MAFGSIMLVQGGFAASTQSCVSEPYPHGSRGIILTGPVAFGGEFL